jgi:DMSO/TMAO reductase YedYZ molybdopterin-dependent catalytic subunit
MANLRVDGEVVKACELSFADLAALPGQVDDVGELIPGRAGGAVRLASILERAGRRPEASHATLSSADGRFTASVPLDAVREAVVAYRLGDAPLPERQGGPLRFFIPDVEECAIGGVDACANVKFLARIELTRGAAKDTRPASQSEHEDLHRHDRRHTPRR